MELNEKLQQLRKQKGWTQQELGEKLFVSRTAISKWETGQGYPSIESLQAISDLFSISIDDLLSGEELITLAEQEQKDKSKNMQAVMSGILDCMVVLLFFLPLFGQRVGTRVISVPLHAFTDAKTHRYIGIAYLIGFGLTVAFGVLELALQNWQNPVWIRSKDKISILLSVFLLLFTIANRQPSASALLLCLLLIKGFLLIRKP